MPDSPVNNPAQKIAIPTPDPVVAAHVQRVTLHITEHIPAHEDRAKSPYHHYFEAARKRLKALGKYQCWICGTEQNLEAHHTLVEESLKYGVDVKRFEQLYPEFGICSDEDFLKFVEGESNLTILCRTHHTGILGIHVLPYPLWVTQRFYRADLPPAGQCTPGGDMPSGVTP